MIKVIRRPQGLVAPFPYFGGKRSIASTVWAAFGHVQQYNEPFCGSAAMLLGAPKPASLEVVGDINGFIANFWRSVKHDFAAVAHYADYPVSHIDLRAREEWLMAQIGRLGAELQDPDWPGDSKVAGWWLWGACSAIGGEWCQPKISKTKFSVGSNSELGYGLCVSSGIPNVGNNGRGITASGCSADPRVRAQYMTTTGAVAHTWLHKLSARLERARVLHGDWKRCLYVEYGKKGSHFPAIFFDPPYLSYEHMYGNSLPVASEVAEWCRHNATGVRIAICGLIGDYDLPGWTTHVWSRKMPTMGSSKTRDDECIWFSPDCLPIESKQKEFFFSKVSA